jgi:hypothetical protein
MERGQRASRHRQSCQQDKTLHIRSSRAGVEGVAGQDKQAGRQVDKQVDKQVDRQAGQAGQVKG